VTHPNVIAIHDVGTLNTQIFIAMEYVEGSTLTDWLAAERRTWPEIVSAFMQAGRGLAAAHAQGLVHRDFKPDNVWIGKDGRARVLDFGVARATWPGIETEPPRRNGPSRDPMTSSPHGAMLGIHLTEPGRFLGTPAYMAPEQLNGGPVDARTDQYSFCVALHQALHGELPFTRDGSQNAIEQRRISGGSNASHVPVWLRRLLRRGLSADRGDRFDSMDRLLEALDHRSVVTRRRILVAGVLALLATALLVGRVEWGRDGLSAGPIRSLAVLPLEALTEAQGQSQVYLAEEITDALTTSLAQIKALHIIFRTSAIRYRGRSAPLSQISRELKVDAVVEGTVARDGERVRVSVHLFDGRNDRHVWAETYERDVRDIMALQHEVARAIADQIGIQLSPGERTRLASSR
jgi:TolB-like protein